MKNNRWESSNHGYSTSRADSLSGLTFDIGWRLAKGVGLSAIRLVSAGENIAISVANSKFVDRIIGQVGSVLDHDLGGGARRDAADVTTDAIVGEASRTHRLETFVLGSCGGIVITDENELDQRPLATVLDFEQYRDQRIAGDN